MTDSTFCGLGATARLALIDRLYRDAARLAIRAGGCHGVQRDALHHESSAIGREADRLRRIHEAAVADRESGVRS